MKIKIQVVPAKGATREVEVDATHGTVAAALEAAGVSPDKMNISVSGKPVSTGDTVPEGTTITLTEKVSGS